MDTTTAIAVGVGGTVVALLAVWILLRVANGWRRGWSRLAAAGASGAIAGAGEGLVFAAAGVANIGVAVAVSATIGLALGVLATLLVRPAPTAVAFGGYTLEGVVGTGATGTVYLARDERGARVAMKVLDPALVADRASSEWQSEIRTMRGLVSPHCVRQLDAVEALGTYGMVYEFVDGASLRAVLDRSGPLAPLDALTVVVGALEGLDDLHHAGLVHGDIKPANVLIDRAGASKLADFGLVRSVGSPLTSAAGSPAYMSPERARGAPASQASDIYACGAMLFELLTGQLPLADPADDARRHQRVTGASPVVVLDPTFPSTLGALVERALAEDPAARPPSARAFLDELDVIAAELYGPDWRRRGALAVVIGGLAGMGVTTSVVASLDTEHLPARIAHPHPPIRKVLRRAGGRSVGHSSPLATPMGQVAISALAVTVTIGIGAGLGAATSSSTTASSSSITAASPQPGPDVWTTLADMPDPRSALAAAVGRDGTVYAIGGESLAESGPPHQSSGPLTTVEAYDPITDTWRPSAALPEPRAGLAAVTGLDGHLYALGGHDGAAAAASGGFSFDPETDVWRRLPDGPNALDSASAAVGPDGKIYVVGNDAVPTAVPSVETYDPRTRTWRTVASIPESSPSISPTLARSGDGRLYALIATARRILFYGYDPRTNTWSELAGSPMLTYGAALSAGPSGLVYTVGGVPDQSAPGARGAADTVVMYAPRHDTWSAGPPMSTRRVAPALAWSATGRLYALGGLDDYEGGSVASAEAFGPAPPGPGCNRRSVLAADPTVTGIDFVRCSGRWAVAAVEVGTGAAQTTGTSVLHASGRRWVIVDRTGPCARREIPADIYVDACEAN